MFLRTTNQLTPGYHFGSPFVITCIIPIYQSAHTQHSTACVHKLLLWGPRMAMTLCPITKYQKNISSHHHVRIWYCILTKSKWYRCSLPPASNSVGATCTLCISILQLYTWIPIIISLWPASEIMHMPSTHTKFKGWQADNNDCTEGITVHVLIALWCCCSRSKMSKDFILNMCSYGLFMKVNFHSCIICFWIIENY